MKKVRMAFIISFIVAVLLCTSAIVSVAYQTGGAYTWNPGVPNYNPSAVIHTGTIDTSKLTMGDFLGISSTQPNANAFGDSGAIVGWDDSWVSWVGHANTNGDALDGLWAQIIWPSEGWWDLGFPTDKIVVFLSQDHGPYLAEGLETRVYGSNTLWGAVSTQAVLTDVFLDGWRTHNPAEDSNGNKWCSDDIAGVYKLPGKYRYVKIAAWSPYSALNEPEVDAVAAFKTIVEIDIKPGSYPNSINPKSKGVVPVAILTTCDFDASMVDPDTVVFLGASPVHWAMEDVDNDGDVDMILHFKTQDLDFSLLVDEGGPYDYAYLTGETTDGTPFEGKDTVRLVGQLFKILDQITARFSILEGILQRVLNVLAVL